MKRVLIVASVISFIEWFNKENLEFLKNQMKCEVHVACNFDYTEDTDFERTQAYVSKIRAEGFILHNIHFARNPFGRDNFKAYKQLKKLIDGTFFDLIHCHTPTASMLTRIASKRARKTGTIVMYTCHGFHFHNAAPKKNWLLYYPVEKWLSKYCDYLVTINKEDFNRAQSFNCKNVRYIPGVGVDTKKIASVNIDKDGYKESIGVPKDKTLLLSIGELIERKNHEVIIRALGKLKNPDIYYAICGKGALERKLRKLAISEGVSDRVIFLGFRKDIPELCNAADLGAFPSKIEGLGLAGIEIMSAGVPLVASNVHGILDYVTDGETGYTCNPDDVSAFATAINRLVSDPELTKTMKTKCVLATRRYDIKRALSSMWDIYKEILVKKDE